MLQISEPTRLAEEPVNVTPNYEGDEQADSIYFPGNTRCY